MRFTQSWLAVGAIVVSMALPSASWAKSSVDTRLERLENIIEGQVTADLLNQVDALQQELQDLRGKIEEQQHTIQLLSQKQESIFLNLDSRIAGIAPSTALTPAVPSLETETAPVDTAVDMEPRATSDAIWKDPEVILNSYN